MDRYVTRDKAPAGKAELEAFMSARVDRSVESAGLADRSAKRMRLAADVVAVLPDAATRVESPATATATATATADVTAATTAATIATANAANPANTANTANTANANTANANTSAPAAVTANASSDVLSPAEQVLEPAQQEQPECCGCECISEQDLQFLDGKCVESPQVRPPL